MFTNYKAVRTAISLNAINGQPAMYDRQAGKEDNNWEQNWIEQITEMTSGSNNLNQTNYRQNKLVIKWWEN